MAARQGILGGVAALALVASLSVSAQASLAQPPEEKELGSANCSTEGGDIWVKQDGARITYWKGHFCRSTDCTTFEVKDIQEDGLATVTVVGEYFDDGNISYQTVVDTSAPEWSPNSMATMYYGAAMREDMRAVQYLFEHTREALAHDETVVTCN